MDTVVCAVCVAAASEKVWRRHREGDTHVVADTAGRLLEKVPLVQQQFQRVGLSQVPRYDATMIVGLVSVSQGLFFPPGAGMIPAWTAEERILWEWCKRRSDTFSVRVVSQRPLPSPLKCATSGSYDNSTKNASLMPLLPSCAQAVLESIPLDEQNEAFIVAAKTQAEILTLVLPPVLAFPMVHGHWHSFLLSRASVLRQRRLWKCWPPVAFWSTLRNPSREIAFELPDQPGVLSTKLLGAADLLRRCVAAVTRSGNALISEDEEGLAVSDAVNMMEGLATEHSDYKILSDVPKRLAPLEHLLETVLLSRVLRRQDALKETLQRAITLVCPAWLGTILKQRLETGVITAMSKTQVYRARQMVDLAFALTARESCMEITCTPETPSLVFLWADASPQWGREWLLGHMQLLKASSHTDLLQLATTVDELAATSVQKWEEWKRMNDQQGAEADAIVAEKAKGSKTERGLDLSDGELDSEEAYRQCK